MKPGSEYSRPNLSVSGKHQPNRRVSRWQIPLFILLFASLACSLPGLGQAIPSATPPPAEASEIAEMQSTLQATPGGGGAPPVEKLPPALVEVDPIPRSNLTPGAALTFFFNQPMERASVEGAFQSSPALPGRFEWPDDSTLRYLPDQAVEPGDTVTISINTNARAANGLGLADEVALEYQAPGPLKVAERLPAPGGEDAQPSSAVVVTFNQPVVPLGAESAAAPAAFTLEPPTNGRGEWLNTSTYIFYPQPALEGGREYTVRLSPDTASAAGGVLDSAESLEWSFSTAAPALISVQPSTETPLQLDDGFTFTFNQPMDRASVEGGFSLLDADGNPVAGEFDWNETGTEVRFQPAELLERSAGYTLILIGSTASQGGALLGKDFAAQLVTVPALSITQTRPAAGEQLEANAGYGSVAITFSAPVAPAQDWVALVTLDPPVTDLTYFRSDDGYKLFLSGYFQPSTNYELAVSPDLRDRWDGALGSEFIYTFSAQPAQPSLVIPIQQYSGSPVLFIPQSETEIQAQSINVERVTFSRGKLTLSEFIQAMQSYEGLTDWQSRVQSTWVRLLYPTRNEVETVSLPLTQTGNQLLDPGLYFYQVDPGLQEGESFTSPGLIVVSPTHLALKVSDRQVFVWAVNLMNDTPRPDAVVTFYDHTMNVLATCVTDLQGACQADVPLRAEPYQPVYAVVGQPGDVDFSLAASSWSQGVSYWDFGLSFENKGDRPSIYLYTDRPIYQPGQTVNYRAVIRSQDNGRYSRTDLTQLTVEVLGPYDVVSGQLPVLSTQRLPLTVYGSTSGSFTLPEEAIPGSYTLRVQEARLNELYFQVAEYRKPEIDLQVSFDNPDQLIGEGVEAEVKAAYFFGAPAGGMSLRWVLYARSEQMRFSGELSNLVTGKLDPFWTEQLWMPVLEPGRYVTEGQGQTGADGTLKVSFDGAELREFLQQADRTLTLTLEVTAEDESGLPVSARGTARLHPAEYYIGLQAESWAVSAGEEITYYVRTLDWQGDPIPAVTLTAHFLKVIWQQDESAVLTGGSPVRMEYVEAGSTDFRSSEHGEARLAFLPGEPGTFLLEVTPAGQEPGSGAVTQDMIWVGGVGSASWPNLTSQHVLLRSDAAEYQPNQMAEIFIPNPFPAGALALVTVERARVMRSQILNIESASYTLELPLLEDDAPNVFVSVTLLGRQGGKPSFRMGYIELHVAPVTQQLQVEVATSPSQAQPGGEVTLNVRVKDAAGNPVQGEFSLALVDKAVLALADPNAPGILRAFYGPQPLGVMNGLGLAVYAGRIMPQSGDRGGGGGGDFAVVPPGVRTRFEDTAYWTGALETDLNGVGQVTVRLPDNLTTWQVDVRGLTVDTRVGEAQAEVVTGKPLLVRPVVPRFAVAGDHFELAAVVHNNTPDTLQAQVSVEAIGFNLDDPNAAIQTIELASGGRQQVSWWGTTQAAEVLDLVFTAQAVTPAGLTLHDATRPEMGLLPVLRYTAPQTFGTSGILSESGEQIEVVSLPRSFIPSGGDLRVELAPSMAASVLNGLEALAEFPDDFTEPVSSRLLPNVMTYAALKEFGLEDAALQAELEESISASLARLLRLQNSDGGWGWSVGKSSDPYLTAYVIFTLDRAQKAGIAVEPGVIERAQDYLAPVLITPRDTSAAWELDRLAFQLFVLQESGRAGLDLASLYDFRARLSPWGKALLALAIDSAEPGAERARSLLSDVQSAAARTATGANWQDLGQTRHNWSTPNFTTAVVVYSLARLDPAATVLGDAVRYLVSHRQPRGAWASSYESAWVLMALVEAMRATGDLQASFDYSAALNGSPVINGRVDGPANALTPVTSTVSLADLRADAPNALNFARGEGPGRLYYRAYLQVDRPAEEAPAVQRGLSLTRAYYRAGQDCREQVCPALTEIDLTDPAPVVVRLTMTLPEDMYYVVVEDYLPAGAEVLNPNLKTSQQGSTGEEVGLPFLSEDPFARGWGWWFFSAPQVYADRVRWVTDFLPAGTYEITYRLTPFLPGEFRLLPAHAWQYYFPEVEATSGGAVITLR